MAIQRMKKVTLVTHERDSQPFVDWLYARRELHLAEITSDETELPVSLTQLDVSTRETEATLSKLERIMEVCSLFPRQEGDFLEGLFSAKRTVTAEDIEAARRDVDVEALFAEAEQLRSRYEALMERISVVIQEREQLSPFEVLQESPGRLLQLRRMVVRLVECSVDTYEQLTGDARAREHIAWEVVRHEHMAVGLLLVWPKTHTKEVQEVLSGYRLKELSLPDFPETVQERIQALEEQRRKLEVERQELEEQIEAFSACAPQVELLLGYWESERQRVLDVQKFMRSPRLCIATGYVPAHRAEDFQERLARAFPETGIVVENPAPTDDVPVAIRLHPFFRPAQVLVNMFGLPDYFSFDPTPFLTFTFLTFFGICFGDVAYGLLLIVLSTYLKRRFQANEGLREFFRLFTYAGVSTVLFGALMGSWASDLYDPAYLGPGNLLLRAKERLALMDPLDAPVMALLAAIGIGVLNQFYGIIMRIYGNARRRDWQGALFDGVFWLLFLPGVIVLISTLFVQPPPWLLQTGAGWAVIGGMGLVLTQGRDQEGWGARLIVGLVSLYGIMGTYGVTSFIGDVLSYSRLLALGLTTTVVGKAFNIVAGLLKPIPVVGLILFVVMLLVGHLFNFIMSILSGFVHSARLILLEFFNRFYSGGAMPFRPFGFSSDRVELVASSKDQRSV